jgi:hypothetical protein
MYSYFVDQSSPLESTKKQVHTGEIDETEKTLSRSESKIEYAYGAQFSIFRCSRLSMTTLCIQYSGTHV